MKASAVRTWNKAHTTAKILVTFPNGRQLQVGGNRAARAEAVILTQFTEDKPVKFYGARADLAKAVAEAHGLMTITSRRTQGYRYAVTPYYDAEAIVVTEEES
jgi:hypothetical protein